MSIRKDKQARFSPAATTKSKKSLIFIGVAVVLMFLGVLGFNVLNKNKPALLNVGPVKYEGQRIAMAEVENVVIDGKVKLALNDIKENKIIYTDYTQGANTIPLTAFITPSGNVVAAVSMCEPCRGTRFTIIGNELVCNACATRWTLEDLKGVWGGCLQHPPDVLEYEVDEAGEYILLDEQQVANWQPRPY